MKSTPRGLRNNNPGNIRINTDVFQGEITPSKDKAFKQFRTMAYGYRSIFRILLTYKRAYKLSTIQQWISKWAPPEDNNDTSAYIGLVCRYSGQSATNVIDTTNKEVMCDIVAGISRQENGVEPDMSEIEAGWRLSR